MNGKLMFLIFLILLIPLIPFLIWNDALEKMVVAWTESVENHPWLICGGTVFLLSVDLFVPIPSSVLSVFCSHQLSSMVEPGWVGLFVAVFVIWLGMTSAAMIAYVIGKLGGEKLARYFVGEEEFQRVQEVGNRRGAVILVILRAVPLFAETAALVLACSGVRFWRVFFWPIALSNMGIALIYAILGSADNGLPFWMVFAASIILPAAVTLIAKIWLADCDSSHADRNSDAPKNT
ncbi:MAG: VTT domain-containing protein [Planctomycetia bacterium]|nr:VTT domain-containing protein [Planctomycetia bacterium]